MKKIYLPLSVLAALAFTAKAQQATHYKRNGYELEYTNNDNTLPQAEQQRVIDAFFEVYPKLAKAYNKHTAKLVNIAIDTAYKGVAETGDAHIKISSRWLHLHPEDIDVVTHEGMHIVQDYGESTGPGWLTEGIADYARNEFGINNAAANWKLPDFKTGQHYDNSYRITARFLLWCEQRKKHGLVKTLDRQLREHTYTDASWKQLTGKTLDELWSEYAANPALNPTVTPS